jgi:hypothetical protein
MSNNQPRRYDTLEHLKLVLPYVIPYIIREITRYQGLTEDEALAQLYSTKLYRQLIRPECGLWTLSALHLYLMYREELETGHITYPVEQ